MNLYKFIKAIIKKITRNQNDVAGVIFLFAIPIIFFIIASKSVITGYIGSCSGEVWTMFDAFMIFQIFFWTSFSGFVGGLFISEKKDNE